MQTVTNTLEKEFERIKKYAERANDKNEKYDMNTRQMQAIREYSPDLFDMIYIAFNFGFEKGRRAAAV